MSAPAPRTALIALAGCLAGGASARPAQAQAESRTGFEQEEAATAVKAAVAQVKELQADLAREKESGRMLIARAAAATAEAKAATDELNALKTRVEALGGGTLSDERAVEKRLLDAINDLRLMRDENRRLTGSLFALNEAVLAYLKAPEAEKPALRARIEAALAESVEAPTAKAADFATRIESSQVVSTDSEHNLVVVNAGERAGLKPGTPLRVYRNDRPVASALVVEVRERLSGALVTTLGTPGDFPAVGDSLRIDTTNN